MKESQIINSHRRIWKDLTKARFAVDKTNKVTKCGDPRCGTCEIIEEGQSKTLISCKILTPNQDMNCKSQNLIYCTTCRECNEIYIGQTGRLIDRVRAHKQQIRDPSIRNTPYSEHFDRCDKGKFRIFPFYKIMNNDENLRRAKEDFFIELLNQA